MNAGRFDGGTGQGYWVSVPPELARKVRAQWERQGAGWSARVIGRTPEGRAALWLTLACAEKGAEEE